MDASGCNVGVSGGDGEGEGTAPATAALSSEATSSGNAGGDDGDGDFASFLDVSREVVDGYSGRNTNDAMQVRDPRPPFLLHGSISSRPDLTHPDASPLLSNDAQKCLQHCANDSHCCAPGDQCFRAGSACSHAECPAGMLRRRPVRWQGGQWERWERTDGGGSFSSSGNSNANGNNFNAQNFYYYYGVSEKDAVDWQCIPCLNGLMTDCGTGFKMGCFQGVTVCASRDGRVNGSGGGRGTGNGGGGANIKRLDTASLNDYANDAVDQ